MITKMLEWAEPKFWVALLIAIVFAFLAGCADTHKEICQSALANIISIKECIADVRCYHTLGTYYSLNDYIETYNAQKCTEITGEIK